MGSILAKELSPLEVKNGIKNRYLLHIISEYISCKLPYIDEFITKTNYLKYDLSGGSLFDENNRYYYDKYFIDTHIYYNEFCYYPTRNYIRSKIVFRQNMWNIRNY
jgi:hypothetical protein